MGRIFVRRRRHIRKNAGRPKYAVIAVEGLNLSMVSRHIRGKELESLAGVLGAEIVYLPLEEEDDSEEKESEKEEENGAEEE